jgi:hypothetical protein
MARKAAGLTGGGSHLRVDAFTTEVSEYALRRVRAIRRGRGRVPTASRPASRPRACPSRRAQRWWSIGQSADLPPVCRRLTS